MSSDNFPGFDLLAGFFERYVEGLKGVGDAWNQAWRHATDAQKEYSVGAWCRDVGDIWARSQQAAEQLYRFPFGPSETDRPVWVSIVADGKASAADSTYVKLSKRVDNGRKVEPTDLERLGQPETSISKKTIAVKVSDARDAIKVSIPLGDKQYEAGTYIGFIKLAGGSGPPIAIVFFSYNKPGA
jgi:hypothetical protein